MADLNQICFSGRLARNAEVKKLGDRDRLSFSVACNPAFDRDAAPIWYSCLDFYSEKRAWMLEALTKGAQVMVTGKLTVTEKGDKTYHNVDVNSFEVIKQKAAGAAAKADAGGMDDEIPF